jgi:hypothetical protein
MSTLAHTPTKLWLQFIFLLMIATAAQAQFVSRISLTNTANQPVVPLAMANGLKGNLELGRAPVFQFNKQSATNAQPMRWTSAGQTNTPGFTFSASNAFQSALGAVNSNAATNSTMKAILSRINLEADKPQFTGNAAQAREFHGNMN